MNSPAVLYNAVIAAMNSKRMKKSVAGQPPVRMDLSQISGAWCVARRFFERRSAYSISACIFATAMIVVGIQEKMEINARGAELRKASGRLEATIAQSRSELLALSHGKPVFASPHKLPPLAQQNALGADLQKRLQRKDINASELVFTSPVFDKDKAWWQQDTTVKLSGPYAAVRDLLIDIPTTLNNVAVISVKLTREANIIGQIECEATLRAYYADDRSARATPP